MLLWLTRRNDTHIVAAPGIAAAFAALVPFPGRSCDF